MLSFGHAMPRRLLFLIGYRGTGKTTIGRLLAERLDVPCIDLDHFIQESAGKTIAELFVEGGEDLFRDWESRCLSKLVDQQSSAFCDSDQAEGGDSGIDAVISLGGGTILRDKNRELISQSGTCIYLTATPKTIWQRLSQDSVSTTQRPALTELSAEQEITNLLAKRLPLYEESADIQIETDDRSIGEIAEAAWRKLAAWGNVSG